jgi:hypothetical protein
MLKTFTKILLKNFINRNIFIIENFSFFQNKNITFC